MAQPIHCDATGCDQLADVLISRLADGDTSAWCNPHYAEVMLAMAAAIAQAEVDETDAQAEARLAELGPDEGPTSSPESSDAGAVAPGQPTKPASGRTRHGGRQRPSPRPTAAPEPPGAGTDDPALPVTAE